MRVLQNQICYLQRSRAKIKALGLAGQAEILIGHLHNLIQSWSNFWVAIAKTARKMASGQLLF